MPAHFGVIRPCGLTSVISHITSPAQPSEKLPRCIRCQSFAEPSLELYWHIGDTTTRLGSVSPRSVIGENRTLAILQILRCGEIWRKGEDAIPRNRNRGPIGSATADKGESVLFFQPGDDLD